MENIKTENVTKECAKYCMQGIVQYLAGDTKKFEDYIAKAMAVNEEIENKRIWVRCKYKVAGKMVQAKLNTKTLEIIDLERNILRSGVKC